MKIFGQSRPWRRPRKAGVLFLTMALVTGIAGIVGSTLATSGAGASQILSCGTGANVVSNCIVGGSPSNFESGDGNMTVENPAPVNGIQQLDTDWNCFTKSPGFSGNSAQPPAGTCARTTGAKHLAADISGEIGLVNGTKFDTPCPGLEVKNTPPKDDFTDIASYNELDSNLSDFFYGATIRSTANGNASGDVEFDQNAGDGTTTEGCRKAGDKLLAYEFLNGGTALAFHVLTWVASGACYVKTDSSTPNGCWGADVVTPPAGLFNGLSNQQAIAAAANGISGTDLAVNQFAEFGMNLTQVLNLSPCQPIAQEVWKTRSSGSSFTSNPEDIEIENVKLNNCGEIKIIKNTDPRGINQVFSYTSNLKQNALAGGVGSAPCTAAGIDANGKFCLNDNGNTSTNNTANTVDATLVPPGTYNVTEVSVPGFTLEHLTCTSDSTSGSTGAQDGSNPLKADITLTSGGVVTCTYVNQPNVATLSTAVSTNASVFPGSAVHDTATITGNQTAYTPSGIVSFGLCGPIPTGSCAGGTAIGTGTLSGTGGVATANSPDVNTSTSPLAPGRYCFYVSWPGDTNYPGPLTENGGANSTDNECFTVQQIPTATVTTPSVGSGGTTTFGASVTDHAVVSATLSGGGTPTGTVTFYICNPSEVINGACTAGTQVGSAVTTVAPGSPTVPPSSYADSSSITASQTGTWCFRAVYTPGGANGANYIGSNDSTSDECFTVADTTGGTSTQTWLPNDTATVTSAHGAPLNGTMSVQLYTGGTCGVGGGSAVGGQVYSKALSGSASTATLTTGNTSQTFSTTTSVSWLVTFTSTDANVAGSTHCEVTSLTITN